MNQTQPIGLHGRQLAWGVGLGNRCTSIQSKRGPLFLLDGGMRNTEKKKNLAGSEKTKQIVANVIG